MRYEQLSTFVGRVCVATSLISTFNESIWTEPLFTGDVFIPINLEYHGVINGVDLYRASVLTTHGLCSITQLVSIILA